MDTQLITVSNSVGIERIREDIQLADTWPVLLGRAMNLPVVNLSGSAAILATGLVQLQNQLTGADIVVFNLGKVDCISRSTTKHAAFLKNKWKILGLYEGQEEEMLARHEFLSVCPFSRFEELLTKATFLEGVPVVVAGVFHTTQSNLMKHPAWNYEMDECNHIWQQWCDATMRVFISPDKIL